MLGKKSKIFVLIGMVALLVVTGVLNVFLNRSGAASGEAAGAGAEASSADFFAAYRADRITTRNQSIMYLDSIINGETSSAEAIARAEQDKLELTVAMDRELVLEGLIKAAGIEDAIVTTTTENVNVIVKSPELTTEQATKVLEIITAETGKSALSVRIIPVE